MSVGRFVIDTREHTLSDNFSDVGREGHVVEANIAGGAQEGDKVLPFLRFLLGQAVNVVGQASSAEVATVRGLVALGGDNLGGQRLDACSKSEPDSAEQSRRADVLLHDASDGALLLLSSGRRREGAELGEHLAVARDLVHLRLAIADSRTHDKHQLRESHESRRGEVGLLDIGAGQARDRGDLGNKNSVPRIGRLGDFREDRDGLENSVDRFTERPRHHRHVINVANLEIDQ